MHGVHVALLGPLEISLDGRTVALRGARPRTLLTRLALAPGQAVRADALVEAVWDSDLPADELHSLQSLVSRLRRALGDSELVQAAPGGYRLAVEPDAVDAVRFERLAEDGATALARGEHAAAVGLLDEALGLWRGTALADVAAHGFAAAEAARLDARRVSAAADRVDALLALGHGGRVVGELEALLREHPANERLAGQLMSAQVAAGLPAEALATYERVRAALDARLGTPPSPALQALHLSVLRGDGAAPAESAPAARRSNLAVALTSFVGRAPELARIDALLEAGRLVTLVGPGGAGKTRLAREATARWVDRVSDGVWIAELAPITDAVEIVPAVLSALGLRETALVDRPGHRAPRDGLERLLDALGDRDMILILDNCEHLVTPAAELAEALLGGCPRLRIVATSREPLAITGESLAPVPPLALPEPGADADEALAHPAVRLFADRAAAVTPGFAVDDRSAGAVVEICRRLDGLPLAIELAAARLRSLPLDEVARRLDDRFRLLTGGSRTALPRHRTLRAVVDWSWELLTEPERRMARRLAVFSAGATADSAAAVCAFDGVEPADVADGLAGLVERSLLHVIPDSQPPRHRMLETIREYGLEQLSEAGEIEAVRGAHARYFADLAQRADDQLRGPGQREWFGRLDDERDNVLAALRWLGDSSDAAGAVRLAVALLWFWLLSGSRDESRAWLAFALAVPGEADPADRRIAEIALDVAGVSEPPDEERELVARRLAEHLVALEPLDDRARPLIAVARPALALFSGQDELAGRYTAAALEHPDAWVRAATLLFAGARAENLGEAEQTREHLAAALAGFASVGDRWGASLTLTLESGRRVAIGDLDGAEEAAARARDAIDELSPAAAIWVIDLRLADVALRRGELAAAREHVQRVIASTSVGGDDRLFATTQLALIALAAGDPEAARRELRGTRALLAEDRGPGRPDRGHLRAISTSLQALIELAAGDVEAADRLLPDAYALAVATTDMPVVAVSGLAVSERTLAAGDPAGAAERLGACAVLRGGDDPAHPLILALRARLRDALGDQAYAAAYRRGRAMTREEAIARVAPATSDAAAVGA